MEHGVYSEVCGHGYGWKKTIMYRLLKAASECQECRFNLKYFLGFLQIHLLHQAFFISNVRKHTPLIVPVTTYMKQIARLSFWSDILVLTLTHEH